MHSRRAVHSANIWVATYTHLRKLLPSFLTCLCCALYPFGGSPVFAQTSEAMRNQDAELKRAHEELLADNSYIFDYTELEAPELDNLDTPEYDRPVPSAFWGTAGYTLTLIFKVGFIALLALIAFFVAKSLYEVQLARRRNVTAKEDEPPIPAYQPDQETARIVLSDAAKLAEQGRYSEAVHVILLRTIADIKAKRPRAVPRDLTSREISTLDILTQSAQSCFREISARVENSLFGGRELNEDDYLASHDAYKRFALPTSGKARKARG